MKKEDIKNIIIFSILLFLIIILLIMEIFHNSDKEKFDRKVKYIGDMNFDEVLKKGNSLYFDVIDLLINNGLSLEKDRNNHNKIYSIDGVMYNKITNYNNVLNKIERKELDKFNTYKNIIYRDNNYYIINNTYNGNYIGSKLNILDYNDNIVVFKNENYYCDNHKYIGRIKNKVDCNYMIKETTFKTTIINNDSLIISDIDDIISVIK